MPRRAHLSSHDPATHDQARAVTKAMLRAADFWRVSQAELSAIVGISASTLSRIKNADAPSLEPGGKTLQLATLFVRVWHAVNTFFASNDEIARRWLREPNAALPGTAIPMQLMQTPEGLAYLCDFMDFRVDRY
jgi:putative toxin-antitoxin system antitoxin component (TIGR02293 family)